MQAYVPPLHRRRLSGTIGRHYSPRHRFYGYSIHILLLYALFSVCQGKYLKIKKKLTAVRMFSETLFSAILN